MKLYIPELGSKLKLESDWTFDLHWEHRNTSLIKHFFGEDFAWRKEVAPRPVTLQKGTVLTVDRIYIRQGASEYSSISFYANISETGKGSFGKPKSPRFWAKLEDCNKIDFSIEIVEPIIKLLYGSIYDVKENEHTGAYATKDRNLKDSIESFCYKVITSKKHVPIFKVKLEYDIEWEEVKARRLHLNLFSTPYIVGKKINIKYTLSSLDDKELGNWKTFASLKKNAKQLAKDGTH